MIPEAGPPSSGTAQAATSRTLSQPVLAARTATLPRNRWIQLWLTSSLVSLVAAVPVLATARSIWPDITLFAPLSSYLRLVPFIVVPLAVATAAFARITRCSATPQRTFLILAGIVLLLSFIPDYILPVAGRTFVASSVAAFLHIVVAVVAVSVLLVGYRRSAGVAAT